MPFTPAGLAAVVEAIGQINARLGYPAKFEVPCPGHMTRDYRPVDGVTVTGDAYAGDRTQHLLIEGTEVGVVRSPDFTGSTATCLLPHELGSDLRLFGCPSPGAALNGLQQHVLTQHADRGKPPLASGRRREFPAPVLLPSVSPGGAAAARPGAGPGSRPAAARPRPRAR